MSRRKVMVWIRDMRGDYMWLARHIPGLLLIRLKHQKWNTLCPPANVPRKEWYEVWATHFTESFGLHGASREHMITILYELGEIFERYGHEPTLQDLMILMESKRYPRGSDVEGYHIRSLTKLRSLVRQLGDVAACERGYDYGRLMDEGISIVFEAPAGKGVSDFLGGLLMEYIYMYRKYNRNRIHIPMVLIFDEERELFRERRSSADVVFDIELKVTRLRAFGVGLIILEQIPRAICEAVTGATRLKLCFNIMAEQLDDGMKIMGLKDYRIRELIGQLPVGQCVGVLGGDRCPRPFLLRVPKFPYSGEGISEAELDELSLRSVEGLQADVLPRFMGYEERMKGGGEAKETGAIRGVVRDVLVSILKKCQSMDERNAQLGIDRSLGNRCQKFLETWGFVTEVRDEELGKLRFLVPTPKAMAWAEKEGIKVTCYEGKGGPVHQYVLEKVEQALSHVFRGARFRRRGAAVNGRQPDSVMRLPGEEGRTVAIQVIASSGNFEREASAIEGIARSGVADLILVVATMKKYIRGIEDAINRVCSGDTLKKMLVAWAEDVMERGRLEEGEIIMRIAGRREGAPQGHELVGRKYATE